MIRIDPINAQLSELSMPAAPPAPAPTKPAPATPRREPKRVLPLPPHPIEPAKPNLEPPPCFPGSCPARPSAVSFVRFET